MAVQKLTSTDAFVVVDFPDAPASGVVRRARKILESSARDLARSATYTFGAFGMERSGASAGVNAEGDGVEGAIEAFVDELEPEIAAGRLHLEPGKGVSADQLAGLREVGTAGPLAGSNRLLAATVVAATAWALGGDLSGRSIAVEGRDQAPPELITAMTDAGATVVDVWGVEDKPWLVWGAEVDAVLAGSRPGTLTHQGAGFVTAEAIVPWGPIPVTTKAFAQLHRAGEVTVIPDFVSTAGYLVGGFVDGDEAEATAAVVGKVVEILDRASSDDDGVLLGACYLAEAFIEGWANRKPFGRPLAA